MVFVPFVVHFGGVLHSIVNIRDRQLEDDSGPSAVPKILEETDTVDLIIDGQVVARIAVADLLPPRPSGTHFNP